jgi:hypothetical protein
MSLQRPVIRAEVHTDDFAFTAKFDALPFFESATPKQIVDLAECDWGGDYPADEVALFFDERSGYDDITRLFDYDVKRKTGFECHVHAPDAIAWLKANRPDVFSMVHNSNDGLGLGVESASHDGPHWDSDRSWTGNYNLPLVSSKPVSGT